MRIEESKCVMPAFGFVGFMIGDGTDKLPMFGGNGTEECIRAGFFLAFVEDFLFEWVEDCGDCGCGC